MSQKKLLRKTIIISAAADGIGWTIAKACMENGATVYISDKNNAALDKISQHELLKNNFI